MVIGRLIIIKPVFRLLKFNTPVNSLMRIPEVYIYVSIVILFFCNSKAMLSLKRKPGYFLSVGTKGG